MSAQAQAVLYEVVGGVATIRLNRPEARNALNSAMCAGLLAVSILVLGLWPAPLLELIAGSVGRVAGLFEG